MARAAARSVARRSRVLAAAWSQLGLGLLVRGVSRGGAFLHVERLVGLVDALEGVWVAVECGLPSCAAISVEARVHHVLDPARHEDVRAHLARVRAGSGLGAGEGGVQG